jgi:hypothetical protein
MKGRLVRELGLDVGARRERKFAAMLKRLSTSAITLLVAAAGLGACVDAKKRFDEFDDRVPVVDASLIDRPTTPIANIDGTWYLVVKALGANIHMFTTWDITVSGATGTLSGTYQPLSTKPVETPPRLPVGNPLTANGVVVDDTASFSAALVGVLDPAANPLTENLLGSQVTLVGNGSLLQAFVCFPRAGFHGRSL